LQATQTGPRFKACKRICLSNCTDTAIQWTDKQLKTEGQLVTWGFMQVGLDKLSFSQLQGRTLVRAGQTSLVISS
jgi:hypothetical protein